MKSMVDGLELGKLRIAGCGWLGQGKCVFEIVGMDCIVEDLEGEYDLFV